MLTGGLKVPDDRIVSALSTVLDKRNHPMLIHCNKGKVRPPPSCLTTELTEGGGGIKHRTGCLVGCLRKVQNWSSTATFAEYRSFSHPKSRSMDQQFIELFQLEAVRFPPPSPPHLFPALFVVPCGDGGSFREES